MSQWDLYVNYFKRAQAGEDIPPEAFGVLSSPGIAACAFLVSPFADDQNIPNIYFTVVPVVICMYKNESRLLE
jgi:hypothetical protein